MLLAFLPLLILSSCTIKVGRREIRPFEATASTLAPLVARGTGPFFGRKHNMQRWLKNVSTDQRYAQKPFSGDVKLHHISSSLYFFDQQNGDPLTFRAQRTFVGRDNPEMWTITPESFFTTGSSVPRFLWNTSGFGPMDFAKAAMIHDWLFEAHHRWCAFHKLGNAEGMEKYADYADPDLIADLPEKLRAKMRPLSIEEAADIMVQCMDWELQQCKLMSENLKKQIADINDPIQKDGLAKIVDGLDVLRHGNRVLGQYHWAIRVPARKYWRADGFNSSMSDTIAKLKDNGSLDLAIGKGVISPTLSKTIAAVASRAADRVDKVAQEMNEGAKAKSLNIAVSQGGVQKTSRTVNSALVQEVLRAAPHKIPAQVRYFHAGDAAIARELADQIRSATNQEPKVLFDVYSGEQQHRTLKVDPVKP
jgi:hypothetical protein